MVDEFEERHERNTLLRSKLEEVPSFVSLVQNVIKDNEYLEEMAHIDPLTGLYTRRILKKVREYGAVIICDIDYFKKVNDNFGHEMGDEVLRKISYIIMNSIRIGDVACRYGGDEMVIILTTDNEHVVDSRINSICEKVREAFNLPNFQVTLSVGVAFNRENESLDKLIEQADKALYQSKENGKNQITYYDKEKVFIKNSI